MREINRKAARLAREAREISGRPALVAGSVGPTGRTLAPFGVLQAEEAHAAFREQIDALLEGGVDLLVLETIGNLDEMVEAVRAAREACDLPVIASMTGNRRCGPTEQFARQNSDFGVRRVQCAAQCRNIGVDSEGHRFPA